MARKLGKFGGRLEGWGPPGGVGGPGRGAEGPPGGVEGPPRGLEGPGRGVEGVQRGSRGCRGWKRVTSRFFNTLKVAPAHSQHRLLMMGKVVVGMREEFRVTQSSVQPDGGQLAPGQGDRARDPGIGSKSVQPGQSLLPDPSPDPPTCPRQLSLSRRSPRGHFTASSTRPPLLPFSAAYQPVPWSTSSIHFQSHTRHGNVSSSGHPDLGGKKLL